MTKATFKNIHAKLVKIANEELEIANGQEAGTAGPQEVVDAIVEVVEDLSAIVEEIPADPSATVDATEEGVAAEPTSEPAAEPIAEPSEEEKELIGKVKALRKVRGAAEDDDEDKDKDEDKEKDAKLRSRIAQLEQKLAQKEKEELATEFAKTYSNDTKIQQAKYNEIIKSKDSIKFLEAKLDAIEEYKESNNVQTYQKPAKNFSAYRYAKKGHADINEVTL